MFDRTFCLERTCINILFQSVYRHCESTLSTLSPKYEWAGGHIGAIKMSHATQFMIQYGRSSLKHGLFYLVACHDPSMIFFNSVLWMPEQVLVSKVDPLQRIFLMLSPWELDTSPFSFDRIIEQMFLVKISLSLGYSVSILMHMRYREGRGLRKILWLECLVPVYLVLEPRLWWVLVLWNLQVKVTQKQKKNIVLNLEPLTTGRHPTLTNQSWSGA